MQRSVRLPLSSHRLQCFTTANIPDRRSQRRQDGPLLTLFNSRNQSKEGKMVRSLHPPDAEREERSKRKAIHLAGQVRVSLSVCVRGRRVCACCI